LQNQFFRTSQCVKRRAGLIAVVRQQAMQNVDFGYRVTAESDDDVPFLQPGLSTSAPGLDGNHQDAAVDEKIVSPDKPSMDRNVLTGNTDVPTTNSSILDQLPGNEFRRVDRGSETDTLGWENHGRVYADNFTTRGHKRTAGVARIQRGIGLNHIVD
jgi:hypothetical protein